MLYCPTCWCTKNMLMTETDRSRTGEVTFPGLFTTGQFRFLAEPLSTCESHVWTFWRPQLDWRGAPNAWFTWLQRRQRIRVLFNLDLLLMQVSRLLYNEFVSYIEPLSAMLYFGVVSGLNWEAQSGVCWNLIPYNSVVQTVQSWARKEDVEQNN